ncbi:hypothetical protein [Thiomicrorhabdus heinhorstiae]|uniref:Nickel/cobalt transporter regulator n=1 Tax=Thiomicrorhabdus heinhorstiae TaxID=2748010 RepID=A0ABS0BWX5_9GAMM|nr:hypothetical protein [Thiomicrorhabdus heinhorstiae]MBF6057494.1 hypothetical protein [Thiomicrorhabdus heinhorstiae]
MKKALLATTVASVLISALSISSAYAQPPQQGQEQSRSQKDNGHKGQGQSNYQKGQEQYKGPSNQPNSYKQAPNNKAPVAKQSYPGAAKSNNQPRASYTVNSRNREVMHHHYRKILGSVNRQHRPQFVQERVIPVRYRPYITPAPYSLKKRIPHIPAGYVIGYYQGYVVVYDPKTFLILTLVDLLVNY